MKSDKSEKKKKPQPQINWKYYLYNIENLAYKFQISQPSLAAY